MWYFLVSILLFSFSCFLFCWFLYHSLKTRLKKIIHNAFYNFRNDFSVVSPFMTYHRVCNYSNTTCVTNGAGTANTSGEPEFTPGFYWGSCYSNFSYMCIFCRSLFVLLYFFFWPLCCLFIYEIRILITSLEYSNPCFKTALAIVPPYFKDKYVPMILFPILSVLMTSTLNLLMILVTILKGILKLVLTYIFSTRDEDCFFSI